MSEKYKWANPQEWLLDQIENEWTPEQIQAFARDAAMAADADDIQDEFQLEMATDGYFDEIEEEDCVTDEERSLGPKQGGKR